MARLDILARTSLGVGIAWVSLVYSAVLPYGPAAPPASRPQAEIAPFLKPPYPGRTGVSAVFDHFTPRNNPDLRNGEIVTFNGYRATGDGWTDFTSAALGSNYRISYDQHEGIDFRDIDYFPVLAAADSRRVVRAGWHDPTVRSYGLGLYVRLDHGNGYDTRYGHLSSLAVTSCSGAPCSTTVTQGQMIGVSGNTGDSGGPHLHFDVMRTGNPPGYQLVDPYGWQPAANAEETDDPWGDYEQASTLWMIYPDVSLDTYSVLPSGSGNALPFPAGLDDYPAESRSLIDDYAHLWTEPDPPDVPDFDASLACWSRSGEKRPGWAVHDYNLYAFVNQGRCWARWHLPAAQPSGNYNVYVHVPQSNDPLSGNVSYAVVASGATVATPVINQEEINLNVLRSDTYSDDPTINSGWIFIGGYHFRQGATNYVEVTNQTEGDSGEAIVVADAVEYVLIEPDATPTPLPTSTRTPTPVPPGTVVSVRIARSSDDAGQEHSACMFSTAWNEVYLGECVGGASITSGFRFSDVNVLRQADILDAFIRFTVDGRYTDDVTVRFYAEASGDAATFSTSSRPEDRSLVPGSVEWHIPESDVWDLGQERVSPSIANLIQAVVDRPDWSPGNAIAVVVRNSAPASGPNRVRRVIGFDRPDWYSGPDYAAQLVIRYTGGIPGPGASPTATTRVPTATRTPTPTTAPRSCSCYILCALGLAQNRGPGVAAAVVERFFGRLQQAGALVDLLQAVRDEVMDATPEGQRLVALYDRFSPDLAEVILPDPALTDEGFAVIDLFVPGLQALVDSRGNEVTITEEMVAAVNTFLDHVSIVAGPDLQQAIADERVRHPLTDLVGLTMQQAWVDVNGYTLEWSPPLGQEDPLHAHGSRTIPVKFTLTNYLGEPVNDPTVTLYLYDATGTLWIGPVDPAANPSDGLSYQGRGRYHFDLPTRDLLAGPYDIVVGFNSDSVIPVVERIWIDE